MSDVLQPTPARRRDIAAEAISDPLGFILREHREQEQVCAQLERLVDDRTKPDARERAAAIIAYLEEELPCHEAVEEDLLLPLLLSRCRDDTISQMLFQLREEHGRDRDLVQKIIDDLRAICAEVPIGLPNDFCINALMLVERWRRHLDWENQTLLPIARKVLSDSDLRALGQAMAAH